VGGKRFPFSFEVVRSCADVLVSKEKCEKEKRRRVRGGGNRGARKKRKGETSVLCSDGSEGGCHNAMNISHDDNIEGAIN